MHCRVLLEAHEMERQRNEHLTSMERVSLLTCSWSVLYNFTIREWAYTTSALLPMQELSDEEGGGLIIRHGRIIRRTRYAPLAYSLTCLAIYLYSVTKGLPSMVSMTTPHMLERFYSWYIHW